MSYDFSASPGIAPSTVHSRTNTGATLTPLSSPIVLGTNVGTNGIYGQWRIDTTILQDVKQLVDLKFRVVAATAGSIANAFELWAVDYGTVPTLTTADYAKALSNGQLRSNYDYAVRIGTIVPAGAYAAGDVFELEVPPRFVRVAGALTGLTDLEIRPAVSGVPDAGHKLVIYGPSATEADRPSLRGIEMTENELLADGNDYREDVDASEHFIAFGMQPRKGTWVKPRNVLPLVSGSLEADADNLMSAQKQRSRATSGSMVPGMVTAGGSLALELQPEVWTSLLRGLCKIQSTTDLGGGIYKHTFRIAKVGDLRKFTFYQRKADWSHQVYPDVSVAAFNISVAANAITRFGLDLAPVFAANYDEIGAGGADAPFLLSSLASEDTNPPLNYLGVEVAITTPSGAVLTGDLIPSINIGIAQDIGAKPALNRKRHINGHTYGGVGVSFDFPMHFQSEVMMREHFGLDSATEFPYVAGEEINFHDLELRMWGLGGDDRQGIVLRCPKFASARYSAPVGGNGQVTASVQAMALHDDTVDGSFELDLYTTELASAFDPETDYITVLPKGYAYGSDVV